MANNIPTDSCIFFYSYSNGTYTYYPTVQYTFMYFTKKKTAYNCTHTHTQTNISEGKPVAALPLPTYEQSQKFEQDGVLELVVEQEPEQHMRSQLVAKKPPGSCLDFTLFCLCELNS